MKRKDYLNKYSTKIASYIYSTAVLESESGNYCFDFEKLTKLFDLKPSLKDDKNLQKKIIEELEKYEGIAEIDSDADEFSIYLYTWYMLHEEEEEEEEE